MRIIGRMLARSLAALAAVLVPLARPGAAPLPYDPKVDLPATAAAVALALGLSTRWAEPTRCRVCAPDPLDQNAREALRWRSPGAARTASDVLASGVIPLGAVLASLVSASRDGHPSEVVTDVLVVAEAAAFAAVPNAVAKDAVARRRPQGGNDLSFYSGHTSLAFSVAAAAATVATLRGDPDAPWVWAGGMTLAAGVGYLRVAGDAHWLTDVVAGAAVGGLVGFAVPWLLHRPSSPAARWSVLPAPGGLALRF